MADAAGDEGETSDGAVETRSEVTVDTLTKEKMGLRASFQVKLVKFSHPAIWTTVLSTTSGHRYHSSLSFIVF